MKTLLTVLSLLLWCAGATLAQEARAVLVGRVVDNSDAALAGAKVIARNLASQTEVASVTNAEGSYTISYLLPGVYKITVEAKGFKSAVRNELELRVGDRRQLDFALEVGQVSEAVEVTAQTPLLEASTATAGMVIDGRRAAELPVVGGNAFYLARLSPGVLSSGGRSAGNPFDYGSGTGSAIVNGTRTDSSEVSLDGAPNMFERNSAFAPPQDLVAEFKIQTTTYDAAVGHATGAVTNVSIKSGGRDLHGTGYFNDSRLRAVPWHTNRFIYDPATGPINQEKLDRNIPSWLHQRWGATATGPVLIPKIYNGRERTFWSFGYEGLQIKRNLSFTGTMPTEAQRRGDFSDLLKLGTQYQIYDPATIAPAAGGRFSRQPIVGNIIPANRISPIAKKILEYWPAPNQPGTADGRNNYFSTQDISRSNRSVLARVDHGFSDKHRAFARFNYNRQYDTTRQFPSAATGTIAAQNGYGAVLDDVYTFSPELVLNLKYSLTYQEPIAGRLSQGFDILSLGLPQSLLNEIKAKSNPSGITFPQVIVDGTTTANAAYTVLGSDGGNRRTIYYQVFAGTVTKILRNHNFRFGGEYRLMRENGFNFGNVAPQLIFSTNWTRGPLDNSATPPIGQGFASFLLGLPTGGAVSLNASRAQQSDYKALFFHDDWRVTQRLTLNLGLRYEQEGAPTERFNRTIRGFDATAANPITARALANYAASPIPEVPVSAFKTVGGLTFAGVNGQSRGLWSPDNNNFAPRIGLAYQLNKKTVVRAGYGIFYDIIGIDRIDVNQGGFNQSTNLIPTQNNGVNFIATLANPFPDGFQVPPGSSQGLSTFLGRGISFFNENPLNPYAQRWSLSVQRELPGRLVAEVAYVGNRGTKLGVTRNLNPIPRQYLSTSTERDQRVIDFLSTNVRNPFFGLPEFAGSGLTGQNVARSQLLRPFPHFGDINVVESVGYSWYHSLQVSVEKRFSQGLTFQSSWTYSKFMEATGYLNDTDLRPEEVISDQDYPHRFVLNGIYELPFGRNKKWLGHANAVVDYLLGGWQFQGWFEGQSGDALGFGNAIVRGNLRDIVLPVGERTSEQWFNLEAVNRVFERNSTKQLANNIRTLPTRFSYIRADGINNFDLSLFKNFKLTERFKGQVRMESFNALNHVQFANPNTTVTNTAFGSVNGEKGHGQRQFTFGFKLLF